VAEGGREVAMSSIGVGEPFVDGGIVFLARPYSDHEWAPVRKAWWWHFAGMVFLPYVYPLVALTLWQQRSGQPQMRRVFWALLLTLVSLTIIGIPLLVVFSRRWYWLWRMGVDVQGSGMPVDRREPEFGVLAQCGRAGVALADKVSALFYPQAPTAAHQLDPSGHVRVPRPVVAAPPHPSALPPRAPAPVRRPTTQQQQPALDEPWLSLVTEAQAARDRIHTSCLQVKGAGTEPALAARAEANAGAAAAADVAWRAARVETAIAGLEPAKVRKRLTQLEAMPNASADLDLAKDALRQQVATADRMEATKRRMLDRLYLLVAQLGEAAARVDELACASLPGQQAPDLASVVDRLAAIRAAIETVEDATDQASHHPGS
jgi:hypothetical protein